MNIHRDVQDLLYEFSRGELSTQDQRRVEEHLTGCKRCMAAAETIQKLVNAVPVSPVRASDKRPDLYWNSFSYNVINRIRREEQSEPVRKVAFSEYLRSVFVHQRRTLVTLTAGVVIVSGIVLTWQMQQSGQQVTQQGGSIAVDGQTPTLQARYSRYLRKSQVLMVGLMNMKQESGEHLDLSAERDLSRQLVDEARYLHEQNIDEHAKQLIRDLEKILIELANIEEQHDVPDVEILRAGIRQENLLFKIRMDGQLYPPPSAPDSKEIQSKKGQSL